MAMKVSNYHTFNDIIVVNYIMVPNYACLHVSTLYTAWIVFRCDTGGALSVFEEMGQGPNIPDIDMRKASLK